jgi:hypothetical protein
MWMYNFTKLQVHSKTISTTLSLCEWTLKEAVGTTLPFCKHITFTKLKEQHCPSAIYHAKGTILDPCDLRSYRCKQLFPGRLKLSLHGSTPWTLRDNNRLSLRGSTPWILRDNNRLSLRFLIITVTTELSLRSLR